MVMSHEVPRPSSYPRSTVLGRKLTPAEVALLETFVVPRYLEKFGEGLLGMMLLGAAARVAHLGCRTGYPDRELLELSDGCSVVGVDASLAAIELARNKAATLIDAALEYQVATQYPTGLPSGSFSHAISLHPTGGERDRQELFAEMSRLLYPGGQALVSLPLRSSFQEVGDLLREFALKHDAGDLARVIESAVMGRPTIESLEEELEDAGLDDIDVNVKQVSFSFAGGRAFTEDPVTRLLLFPELSSPTVSASMPAALAYLNDAIDKYWSRRDFELAVVIGSASARKA